MRKIEEIPKSKIKEMKEYYDPLVAGICIQKYIETEDGKGDFMPVYANASFAESMGVPIGVLDKYTLRQASREFPDKQLAEMVEVALEGKVINGESFSRDYSKYFTVRIYQYAYGYTINFMSDVTSVHINGSTLQSVSRAYETIYYARLLESVCSRVHPALDEELGSKDYEALVKEIITENNVHPDDVEMIESFFDRAHIKEELVVNDVISKRFRSRCADGSSRWNLIDIIVNERGMFEPLALVITVKDINDIVREEAIKQEELKRAYERVKSANESKQRFLAHMSHDIRTPINGILGMLQLCEDSNDPALHFEYYKKIKTSTERLLAVFTEVLDISKLDEDSIAIETDEFSLYQAKMELEDYRQRTGVDIEITFGELNHPIRICSEAYLRQVVLKLIDNAIRFNKDNNPIEIKVEEHKDSDLVSMKVIDHGIGISEKFIDQIFDPFTQERDDARTNFEGTGLGLTYVKRVIDKMGGQIFCESTEGEGTEFEIILPLEIAYERERAVQRNVKRVTLIGKKALVVEDNDINALIVENFLQREGMVYERAVNGKIALDKFIASKEDEYDVILMDIMMPVMNGLEATVAIRASEHAKAESIPIIGVSANYFAVDVIRGLEAGMNAYLSKPLNRLKLIETIAEHMK